MSTHRWTTNDIPPQSGRRVVITGGNSGIGFYTAVELARKGAEVVLPARTLPKSLEAIARIRAQVPDAKLAPGVLDLAALASVRAFAADYTARFPGRSIDLHINNAGVMAVPRRELTIDGFERQFETNYLGPFALTALLFPHLNRRAGTRIVTVCSTAANYGAIDFENLQSERGYKPMWGAYAQSKLADLVFAVELQRRLTAASSPIVSVAAHPGFSMTNLQSSGPGALAGWAMWVLGVAVQPIASQSAERGALPTLFAAAEPGVQPGGYYGPDGIQELKGFPAPARVPPAANDRSTATRLWAESERLTGIRFDVDGERNR